jgi:hypothetical protein
MLRYALLALMGISVSSVLCSESVLAQDRTERSVHYHSGNYGPRNYTPPTTRTASSQHVKTSYRSTPNSPTRVCSQCGATGNCRCNATSQGNCQCRGNCKPGECVCRECPPDCSCARCVSARGIRNGKTSTSARHSAVRPISVSGQRPQDNPSASPVTHSTIWRPAFPDGNATAGVSDASLSKSL